MNTLKHSALSLAKRGLSKQRLLHLLTNKWELTSEEQKLCSITHYFMCTYPTHIIRLDIRDGCITDNDIQYCVIYRSCTPASLRTVTTVRISFRASGNGNFALIQPVTI